MNTMTIKQLNFINNLQAQAKELNINYETITEDATMKEASIYISRLLKLIKNNTTKTNKETKEVKSEKVYKTFRIMTKEEVRDYALKVEKDSSWADYYIKHYIFIKFNDGFIFDYKKPHIKNSMYTPDEIGGEDNDAITINKENFIYYNLKSFDDYGISSYLKAKKDLEKNGCCSGCYASKIWLFANNYSDNNIVVPSVLNLKNPNYEHYSQYFVRDLTEEEEAEIISLFDDFKNKFIERLEKYYKRYSHCITSSTYWADR